MSIALGGALQGLGRGIGLAQARKEREAAAARAEEDMALRRDELAARREDMAARREYGVIGTPFVSGEGSSGGGSTAPYDVSSDPVAEGLTPNEKAFLNMVAGGESSGRYNVRYTPQGGASFEGYDQHPGIYEQGPHGRSSAAGRYQFVKSTWDSLGGGAFTPEMQDRRALALARRDYRSRTGRDFDADLASGGVSDSMIDALAPTWAALGKNRGRHAATYRASLDRYSRHASETEAPVAPAEAAKTEPPLTWAAMRRIMTS